MKFVYLFKCGSAYKIGITNNVVRRFQGIRNITPHKIEFIAATRCYYEEDADYLESELHAVYKDKKIHHEWFKLNKKDVDNILENDFTALGEILLPPMSNLWGEPSFYDYPRSSRMRNMIKKANMKTKKLL